MDRINVQGYIFVREPEFKFLLLKRTPERAGYWQPVCGGVEEGEFFLDALLREIKEETGVAEYKSIWNLDYTFDYREPKNGVPMDMRDYCYALELENEIEIEISDEHEKYSWCTYEEAIETLTWEPAGIALDKLKNEVGIKRIESFERLKDNTLNKKYDVFKINEDGKTYIIKYCPDRDEFKMYNMLSQMNIDEVPKIINMREGYGETCWITLEYINGKNLDGWNFDGCSRVVGALARINSREVDEDKLRNENTLIQKRIQSMKKMEINHKYDVNIQSLEQMNKIIDEIIKRPQGLTQGDLLPINTMVDEDVVKIIDWELGGCGIYTLDLGRLLGDLNSDRGEGWINRDFEEELIEIYYQEIIKQGKNISREEFLNDLKLAKWINYFGIVSAHILRGWDVTEWYRINLFNMKEIMR